MNRYANAADPKLPLLLGEREPPAPETVEQIEARHRAKERELRALDEPRDTTPASHGGRAVPPSRQRHDAFGRRDRDREETEYAARVRQLEAEGMTTSDAQASADAEGWQD